MNFTTQISTHHLKTSKKFSSENNCIGQQNKSDFSNKSLVFQESHKNKSQKQLLNNCVYRNVQKHKNINHIPTCLQSVAPSHQNNINRQLTSRMQQQVIYLNNRKFVKSKSPPRIMSPLTIRKIDQENKFEKNHPFMSETMKLKILQNRIIQLHQQKQSEIFQLLNENKRIQKQLQIQKQKTRNFMNNSNLFTPIKGIKISDEQYFEQHEKRIQDMKKRIIDLQKALSSSKLEKNSLKKQNQELKQQNLVGNNNNQNYFSTPPSLKQIQSKKVRSNSSPIQQLFDDTIKESDSQSSVVLEKISQQQVKFQLQNKSPSGELVYLRNEVRILRMENQMKNDLIIQKQENIQKISRLKLQQQQQVKLLKAQIKFLLQKIKSIEQGFKQHQGKANADQSKNTNGKPAIPVTFADSQTIDLKGIRNQKLQNVSFGQSFIINQKNEPNLNKICKQSFDHDSQYMSIGSPALETPRQSAKILKQLRESGYQKQLSQFKLNELNDQDDFAVNQASLQVSMSNIFGKIQHLTLNNDKIQQENKSLKQMNELLKYQNRVLEHKLNMIYQIIHQKQQQVDSKKVNQLRLKNSSQHLEGTKVGSYNQIFAQVSTSGQKTYDSVTCLNCIQLRKLISKMKTADASCAQIDTNFI